MIVGFCFYDNTVERIFRKVDKYCARCGQPLKIVEVDLDGAKNLQFKELE